MKASMLAAVLSMALVAGPVEFFRRMLRETSSSAANARGMRDFQQGRYAEAAGSFRRSGELSSGASAAFNLGTAEIAAGKFAEGAASIAPAMKDGRLRPDSLYNRGTGALRANANDNAIRDLSDVLRMRPGDGKAKRNLEIALRKKEESKRESQKTQQPQSDPEEEGKSPDSNESQKKEEQSSAEAMLRAVQQQEREELTRMRRSRPAPEQIGW